MDRGWMGKPAADEYVATAERYIGLVQDGSLIEALRGQEADVRALLGGLTDEQAGYRYAEGKWTLRTVVGHVADLERVWQYRLLRIARGDAPAFTGYDRDAFAANSPHDRMPMADVLRDYSAVRESTLTLLAHLSAEAILRRGEFNGHPLSARAAAYIIAGHERHHMNVIREKYLVL
jgi:uncharacterized damage-inducible protein DinB